MAKRYVWLGAMVVLGVACSGEPFSSAPAALGGAGGGGSGGSAGKSGSGGGSGAGTGGSTGGNGGGSATGGAGGTGGEPACPLAAPLEGAACPRPDHSCAYPTDRCCWDEYTCAAEQGWVYDGCVGTPVVPACPATAPTAGTPCDLCSNKPDCLYVSCPERSVRGSCDGSVWSVVETVCLPFSCSYGQTFADRFIKDCVDNSDCVTATIKFHCDGTPLVVGVNASDAERLMSYWTTCTASQTSCGSPGLPRDESGVTASDAALIGAKCVSQRCISVAPTASP